MMNNLNLNGLGIGLALGAAFWVSLDSLALGIALGIAFAIVFSQDGTSGCIPMSRKKEEGESNQNISM